jgi:hypothetical protein
MHHMRALVFALFVLEACKGNDAPADAAPTPATKEDQPSVAPPTTEQAFLAELAPLPDGAEAIEVRYRITQSTGSALSGEMTVTLAVGGNRREQWELRAGTGEAELRTTGLRIVSADRIWIANEGAPGELSVNHLGALARAYLGLDEQQRVGVIESIRSWHRMLAEQRERDDAARSEVLGVACLQTRIAAQNVCMWEETGLLLRYEGSAFRIEALGIDRSPQLSPDTFALPPEAQAAAVPTTAEPPYEQILRDIAAGSYGSVSALLLAPEALPELRAPAAIELAPGTPAP